MIEKDHSGQDKVFNANFRAVTGIFLNLTSEDFAYILDTFPVLRKKGEKAFGEFMSKHKCLEEYDRIEPILKGS